MPRKKKVKSEMAKRYQAAYDKVYKEFPIWKKQAIEEDCPKITDELAKEVTRVAELEDDSIEGF